jgi:hypothetical protein
MRLPCALNLAPNEAFDVGHIDSFVSSVQRHCDRRKVRCAVRNPISKRTATPECSNS